MTTRQPINPGRIAWTGQNHCLFLEAGPQGPWTGAFTLFHVDHSLHGPGQGVFAVTAPEASSSDPANVCITNNEKLFRWLASEIVADVARMRPWVSLMPPDSTVAIATSAVIARNAIAIRRNERRSGWWVMNLCSGGTRLRPAPIHSTSAAASTSLRC